MKESFENIKLVGREYFTFREVYDKIHGYSY